MSPGWVGKVVHASHSANPALMSTTDPPDPGLVGRNTSQIDKLNAFKGKKRNYKSLVITLSISRFYRNNTQRPGDQKACFIKMTLGYSTLIYRHTLLHQVIRVDAAIRHV